MQCHQKAFNYRSPNTPPFDLVPRLLSLIFLSIAIASRSAAETRIQITGLRQKTEAQVLELMGGMLTHVQTSDAAPSRANDAAFLLTQVLLKDGYAEVQVEPQVVSRRHIRLNVREGLRLSLGEIKIEGAPADDLAKLVKLYTRPAERNQRLTSGSPPFREQDIATGLSNLRQQLNAEGYWAAEATLLNRRLDPFTGKVDLNISLKMGPRHRIGSPEFGGSDSIGFEQARATTKPFVGKVATTGNLNAMRLAVDESFITQGYPDAKILMGQSLSETQFNPLFTIELGKRVKLRDVHVEGLRRTSPERLKSRFTKLEGDWYNEAAMNKRLRGLLGTGAFSSVRLEKTDVSDDVIDATLHLEEARAKEFSFAAGADSYQGALLRTTYTDRNLMGRLLGFSSGFEFSSRGVLGETRLTDPWLFGSDIAGTARFYALIYGREGYSSFESGVDGKLTWKANDHYTIDILTGLAAVNLNEDGLPSSELGETVYTHPKIVLTQSLDYRDSAILPKSGWHLESPLEIGAAVGKDSTAYAKAGLSGGWYHELNKKYQIGIGGESGLLFPTGDGVELPIDLRLFNGGSRSVRSFAERDLGPNVQGYPVGGEAMWNTNLELIRNLSSSLKAVSFIDAGSLARNFDDLGASDVEVAVGLGIRLDLPIGPVRLEYGYNLTRDVGEPTGTIHFAIGAAF